jgi:hypothetical protein
MNGKLRGLREPGSERVHYKIHPECLKQQTYKNLFYKNIKIINHP